MSKSTIIAVAVVLVVVIAGAAAYIVLNGDKKDNGGDDNTVTISVDDSIEVGTYFKTTTTVSMKEGDYSSTSTDTTTYTVTAIDESGNLTVTTTYSSISSSTTATMTEAEFRDRYVQMDMTSNEYYTFTLVGTEKLSTVYGDVVCNVYDAVSKQSTTSATIKYYVCPTSGAALKASMETSGEEDGVSYYYSMVAIVESSMYSAS